MGKRLILAQRIPECFIRVGPLSIGSNDEAESQVKVVSGDNGYYRDQERDVKRRKES